MQLLSASNLVTVLSVAILLGAWWSADWKPSDPKVSGRQSIKAGHILSSGQFVLCDCAFFCCVTELAPRRVALLGADTPAGVALLNMLGRTPLIEHIVVPLNQKQSTRQPDFWPPNAVIQQVDAHDVAALTAALRGLDTLYWTFPGPSVRLAHSVGRAAKAAGISHLSVVTSTAWGGSRWESARRVERALRDSGVARVSFFRPRIMLLPAAEKGTRGGDMEREAQEGLRQASLVPKAKACSQARQGAVSAACRLTDASLDD